MATSMPSTTRFSDLLPIGAKLQSLGIVQEIAAALNPARDAKTYSGTYPEQALRRGCEAADVINASQMLARCPHNAL